MIAMKATQVLEYRIPICLMIDDGNDKDRQRERSQNERLRECLPPLCSFGYIHTGKTVFWYVQKKMRKTDTRCPLAIRLVTEESPDRSAPQFHTALVVAVAVAVATEIPY
jgi:hypothetical protein